VASSHGRRADDRARVSVEVPQREAAIQLAKVLDDVLAAHNVVAEAKVERVTEIEP
jgi:hypothetical protein